MGEEEQALIPGLPEDIALDCLARVPHQFHLGLRPVCRKWRDLITAPFFRHRRERIGAAEDLIFLVQALVPADPVAESAATGGEFKEENKNISAEIRPPIYDLTIYNATLGTWHRAAASPALPAIPMFSQCAADGGKLVVIGGWDPVTFDPVSSVLVIDLATGEWRRGRPMAAARSFFACAAAGGKVYVAGGHDGQKNALRSAEAYDVEADEWAALPPMAEERDECRGVAIGGRFWAVSGYRTESQGLFDSAAECYDPASGEWKREEGVWDGEIGGGGACFAVPAAAKGGGEERFWCVDFGSGERRGVREYGGRERGWRVVGAVPEGVRSSTCAGAMGGGGRVFVMGGGGEERVGNGVWVMEVGSRKWMRVETPVRFSGFVYSAAAVRI